MKRNKLQAVMTEKEISGQTMAKSLKMCPKTFYSKMKTGDFGIDDVRIFMQVLGLTQEQVIDIFLSNQ